MKRHTIRAILLGAVLAAVAAAPASAGTTVAVAGGLGGNTTRCTLVVHKKDWSFSSLYNFDGSTTCTVAVSQSCSVTLGYGTSSNSLFGTVCSVASVPSIAETGSTSAAVTTRGAFADIRC